MENQSPDLQTTLHVGRARAGEMASVEWLVERFSPLLLANATYRMGKILREVQDSEDVVNDVWLRVLPKLPELSPRDGRLTPVFAKYLSRTLVNRINELLEKHIKGKPRTLRGASSSPGAQNEEADPVAALPAETRGVVTRLVEREKHEACVVALRALGKEDRELVILRGVESRPYKELAVLLQKDAKVLAVCYQRALEKLRRQLPGTVFDDLQEAPETRRQGQTWIT